MPESAAEDFDAAAAAARALGDSPNVDDGDAPTADGGETADAPSGDGPSEPLDADRGGTDGGPLGTLRRRLLSTEPNPPLESEELSTWDVEAGGRRRIKRGIYKITGADGATALEDLLLGTLEEFSDGAAPTSTTSSDGDDDEDGGDVPPLVEDEIA